MPALQRVVLLTSRDDPATSSIASATQNAARLLGIELEMRNVESVDNLEGMLQSTQRIAELSQQTANEASRKLSEGTGRLA